MPASRLQFLMRLRPLELQVKLGATWRMTLRAKFIRPRLFMDGVRRYHGGRNGFDSKAEGTN
jgi:hypothetical protein